MPALRYSEDTEFNDALRARGILPPLPDEPTSPEPTPAGEVAPEQLIDQLDSRREIEELELDDQIPASLIDTWKSNRLSELRHANQISNSQLPGVKPISKEDYIREVNQASEVDIDPSSPHANKGTGVVICLWNNSPASQHILTLLDKLSHQYPTTRFLSIPGGSCIANYPDVNQPTLICYRCGNCIRQYVGIGSNLEIAANNGKLSAGLSLSLQDLETELLEIGILDQHLKIHSSRPHHLTNVSDQNTLLEDLDFSDSEFVHSNHTKKNIRVDRYTTTDSDSDLDI